jgi:hypothetical protein
LCRVLDVPMSKCTDVPICIVRANGCFTFFSASLRGTKQSHSSITTTTIKTNTSWCEIARPKTARNDAPKFIFPIEKTPFFAPLRATFIHIKLKSPL